MRNRHNSISAFTSAILLEILLCSTLVVAQQSGPVQDWLTTDCAVGQEGRVSAALALLGAQAVATLSAAAQNGPDASVITQRQADLSDAYDNVQNAITLAGANGLGIDASDVATVQAQTRQDFIAEDINGFVLNYRIRALQGLGVVGGSAAIQLLQQFANDSSSPDLQAVAKETLAGIFSTFSARLESSGGTTPVFELNAKFTLSAGSDGINPLTEPVTVQVGTFFRVIPPGSFRLSQYGGFVFEGVINGANLEVRITPFANNSFAFNAEGGDVDLTTLTNPVPVALAIGDDQGLTTASAESDD